MVACFISEVEQDRLLGAEDRQQGIEIAQTGYISERHKSLYPCMAVIHNIAYMLSGEKMTSRLKHPANFPTPSHALNQDISHGTTLVCSVGSVISPLRDFNACQTKPYRFMDWDTCNGEYCSHEMGPPKKYIYDGEKLNSGLNCPYF